MYLTKPRISIKTIPKYPICFSTYSHQSDVGAQSLFSMALLTWILSPLQPATHLPYRGWAKCAALLFGLWGTSAALWWKRRKAQVPAPYFAPSTSHVFQMGFLMAPVKDFMCYWGGLNNLSSSTLIIILSESWDVLGKILSRQDSAATPQLELV